MHLIFFFTNTAIDLSTFFRPNKKNLFLQSLFSKSFDKILLLSPLLLNKEDLSFEGGSIASARGTECHSVKPDFDANCEIY